MRQSTVRRTSRPRRASRAGSASVLFALLVACALVCLFGFAAAAHAATPGKPVAKAPKGTLIATRPTFTWRKVGGATRYEVRVYKGAKLLVKKTGIKTLSWKCTKTLPMNVSLTWTVRASNAHATGAWSKSLAFKVVSPYAPQGTVATLTPTCKWIKVKGATQLRSARLPGQQAAVSRRPASRPCRGRSASRCPNT